MMPEHGLLGCNCSRCIEAKLRDALALYGDALLTENSRANRAEAEAADLRDALRGLKGEETGDFNGWTVIRTISYFALNRQIDLILLDGTPADEIALAE